MASLAGANDGVVGASHLATGAHAEQSEARLQFLEQQNQELRQVRRDLARWACCFAEGARPLPPTITGTSTSHLGNSRLPSWQHPDLAVFFDEALAASGEEVRSLC